MTLSTRKLGDDNVTEIGFGTMGMVGFYNGQTSTNEDALNVFPAESLRNSPRRFYEEGCTLWDTADIYHDSEVLMGKWFDRNGKRDQIFLATKFGFTMNGPNNSIQHMKTAFEQSLKSLATDHIDLYYLHVGNLSAPWLSQSYNLYSALTKVFRSKKTVRAMAELVKEGKVNYLGLSEISAETLRRAHPPIAAVQVEYSLFSLTIEHIGFLKACRQLGVTVVAYSPLGRGMLTGFMYKTNADFPDDDLRKHIQRHSDENLPNILKVVNLFTDIGKATASQITLAWLLAQGQDIIPIPGTRRIKCLKENLESSQIKHSTEEIARIRDLTKRPNLVRLDRYPEGFDLAPFADTVKE
ncbi:NADP-dependent oxidoreductase domain-containing protein [Crepidotus variabilis]|uniref:NADP-dependent oxidoreductase domain-containing protein n=1 Tax=Crepidotus variabilis TaxID=179855 RepID=A0A9P6E4F3_9AGAR|nr:NADP-dependent oxidoreductase domain-containing protein [Crepidotus variabilis]